MGKEIIFMVEEAPEGGFTARALGQSIFTEAETLDELKAMMQDAVRCHFGEEGDQRISARIVGLSVAGMLMRAGTSPAFLKIRDTLRPRSGFTTVLNGLLRPHEYCF